MPVKIEKVGQLVTARLVGEVDHHTARQMRLEIDNALQFNMPTLLIIDFSEVSFMDSSGVGLVMGRYRELAKTGAELQLTGMSSSVIK
ncbi:MAG: anti-sigma factor antagonist [Clostridiales bacterium]|nr:anti-sigma factor antagonist [Candidatus Equinaster intestinalis]